jgi:hypothetical protein
MNISRPTAPLPTDSINTLTRTCYNYRNSAIKSPPALHLHYNPLLQSPSILAPYSTNPPHRWSPCPQTHPPCHSLSLSSQHPQIPTPGYPRGGPLLVSHAQRQRQSATKLFLRAPAVSQRASSASQGRRAAHQRTTTVPHRGSLS